MATPKYLAVIAALRDAIGTEFGAACSIPTEAALCERFEVSRPTLRRALNELRAEGLLQARQGSGWRTTSIAEDFALGSLRITTRDVARAPISVSYELVRAGAADPPQDIASLFRVRTRKLLVAERVGRIRRLVVHHRETWFAPRVDARLERRDAIVGAPARLVRELGFGELRFEQFAEAVLAEQRDADLELAHVGAPILQVTRVAFSGAHRLFVSRHRHPGEHFQLAVALPTTDNDNAPAVVFDGIATPTS